MSFQYDVAISFLARDHATAAALRELLRPTMRVFEFSSRQEEIAGTDGLTTFKSVFGAEARLVVVLYRDGWGDSPWTRVEHLAIQERFLSQGPAFLLFVMLDTKSTPPPWVPETRIRLNLAAYGLEQAAGAIRLRVEDLGGSRSQESIAERARRAAELRQYALETEALRQNGQGIEQVRMEATALFQLLAAHWAEAAAAAPSLSLEWNHNAEICAARTSRASVQIQLRIRFINSLSDSALVVRDMSGGIILPGENKYYVHEPEVLDQEDYEPDRRLGVGWTWKRGNKWWTSADLAEHTARKLLDRVEQA